MINNNFVTIKGNSRNIDYYRKKGYSIEVGKEISVNVNDLSHGSTFLVDVSCDTCLSNRLLTWSSYLKYTTADSQGKYYCKNCAVDKRINTNIEKYGGKSPTKSNSVVEKIKKTNLERYGNASSLHGINQSKTDSVFIEKWGHKTVLKNEGIKEKIRKTLIEKWGVDSPLKNKQIIDKLKETNIERWGVDNPSKNASVKEKIKDVHFNKWGDYFVRTDEFKEKTKQTNQTRYNSDFYQRSESFVNQVIENKIKNYNLDVRSYTESKFIIFCEDCESLYDIRTDLIYNRHKNSRKLCTKCNTIGAKYSSSYETEICSFLDESGINYITNTNSIIYPHQIDIFCPDIKFGIEFNGIYWHNEYNKDKYYHMNKYKKSNSLGVRLLQIWEDDWINKKEIIKSIILNKIGIIENKTYARNCEIKEVSPSVKKQFLNSNHIQGTCKSKLNIGLFYKNELVSLMTFGPRRINSKLEWELIRFCSLKNLVVIGGFSKLLNYFKNNYKVEKIISYSDNCISDGDVYEKAGFVKTNESLNYYWCDGKTKYHRFKFNKKRLIKEGYDPNRTEVDIMHSLGYYRIWSAGNKRWELNFED